MSGEAVLVPIFVESVTGIAGAINAAIEARKELARREAQAQRQRIAEWRMFQSRRSEEHEQAERLRERVQDAHRQLLALGLGESATRREGGPMAKGFVGRTNTAAGTRNALLLQIEERMQTLPDELFSDARAPFARLRQQFNRLNQHSTTPAEIRSFDETLQRSLEDYLQLAERELAQSKRMMEQSEALLSEILETKALSVEEGDARQLEELQTRLLGYLTHNNVTPASLDIIATRFRQLREKIEQRISQDEMSDFLTERVAVHLKEMGYSVLAEFSPRQPGKRRDAEFALPDGDRLRVALQPDLRIGFQLSHATETVVEKTLSGEALEFFRQQEARWCRDMKELIRRLIKDGVPYEVQFEREIPDAAIPMVAVETVDDLLEDEEEDEEFRRPDKQERHFP